MKRAFIITILLIVTVVGVSLVVFSEDSDLSIVVLGDSIASGYGVEKEQSYSYLVAEKQGYTLKNNAISGYDTADLLTQLNDDEQVITDVEGANVIVISIGGNDFLGKYDLLLTQIITGNMSEVNDTMANFEANFTKIIQLIKQLNDNSFIIVQTLYNPFYDIKRNLIKEGLDTLNAVYFSYLNDHPNAYVIADVAAAFNDEKFISDDNIHPSILGQEKITEVILSLENLPKSVGKFKIF